MLENYPCHVTYNSLLQGNQLLLLLLPAFKVSIDQPLQLNQVLVLTFLLDVLWNRGSRAKLRPTEKSHKSHGMLLRQLICVSLHQSPLSHRQGFLGQWAYKREGGSLVLVHVCEYPAGFLCFQPEISS